MKKLTTFKALVIGVLSVVMITVLAGFVADAYGSPTPAVRNTSTSQTLIGMEKAKALVLDRLGVSMAIFTQQEYDREDGVYELELISGNTACEFEVNAFTGAVLEMDREPIPTQNSSRNDVRDDRYDNDWDDRYDDDWDDRYDDDWDDRYDDDWDDRYDDDWDDRYDDDWDDRYDDDWDDRYDL